MNLLTSLALFGLCTKSESYGMLEQGQCNTQGEGRNGKEEKVLCILQQGASTHTFPSFLFFLHLSSFHSLSKWGL